MNEDLAEWSGEELNELLESDELSDGEAEELNYQQSERQRREEDDDEQEIQRYERRRLNQAELADPRWDW